MTLITHLPKYEKPREKAFLFGVDHLSNVELLALVLRTGTKQHSALEVAYDLLIQCNGLAELSCANLMELIKVKGISKTKAIEIQAIFELMRRTLQEEIMNKDVFYNVESIIQWLRLEIGCCKVEKFLVLFLDIRHQLISYKIMSEGTIDHSVVYCREVLKEALLRSAASIILVHNHPSGNLIASYEDIEITKALKKNVESLGIQLMDHLIVSNHSAYSILNEEYMTV